MENIESHIEKEEDPDVPQTSLQQRRHIEGELEELETYVRIIKKRLKQEIITIPLHLNFIVIQTRSRRV